MYRKPRSSEGASILNLDSLMDILSCLVGVMLFLVIYTVLELGSTSFEVSVPTPRDRPLESRRVFVVVNNETLRIMNAAQPVSDLLTFLGGASIDEVPERVAEANISPPTDNYFGYRIEFDRSTAAVEAQIRDYDIEVFELPGEVGERIDALDGASTFEAELGELDPSRFWLEFAVDSASVDLFRRARDIAEGAGFATRWGPLDLNFPVTYSLNQDPAGPSPRTALSKPLR
ncbi:MAG: hypothetical protein AAF389_14355 [Gemmatimonadota bacterium]